MHNQINYTYKWSECTSLADAHLKATRDYSADTGVSEVNINTEITWQMEDEVGVAAWQILPEARILGARGGSAKSERKQVASRANGRKGGRPRKEANN